MKKQKDTVTTIAELQQRIASLTAERDSYASNANAAARTINDQRGKIESLQKDIEAFRGENVTLRENLQRCKGYIDRVNEDSEPMEPIIEPAKMHERQRGPMLINLGGLNPFGECDDGMSNYPRNRSRNYG